MVRGEYGREMTLAAEHVAGNMDKLVSSFIRSFEENYSKLETAIRKRVDWTGKKKGRGGARGGGAVGAVAAAAAGVGDEWGERAVGPRLGVALAASSDDEEEQDSEMSV